MSRKLTLICCLVTESLCVCAWPLSKREAQSPSRVPLPPKTCKTSDRADRAREGCGRAHHSMLPTTQQQRLATLHAPACQRYYASRLAAESPYPSTFDVPRGIYRPSTTGTKMLVKRAWTLEDVVADPDTFELIRHPSREPFTLPLWVRHGLRTAATQHDSATRACSTIQPTHARPLCADPHGATVCQSIRRPACGVARAGGVEVWHHHAQRSAVPPHAKAAS